MYHEFENGFTRWFSDVDTALEYCDQHNTCILKQYLSIAY